jgi:hypothetical protein
VAVVVAVFRRVPSLGVRLSLHFRRLSMMSKWTGGIRLMQMELQLRLLEALVMLND